MRVGLGVTGGIAAYKAAELLRLLQDRGLEVQVIMTRSAQEFITPLTFASLSGRKVITEMFSNAEGGSGEASIEHIAAAQEIGALVIAPATAGFLAKLAHGIADDFLTTLALATRAPIIVAPSMNVNMFENAATRANLSILREREFQVIEPQAGYLACGMRGPGRLADPPEIAQAVFKALRLREDLRSENLLVTAGPTHEPIDPVRFLGNRSSGKMGYALVDAGRRRGARVTLVSGPARLDAPADAAYIQVQTAEQMAKAVLEILPSATAVVMAAAVADFQAEEAAPQKIKRDGQPLTLKLKPTRDILSEVCSQRQPDQIVVGFAAETDHVIENASAKLRAKHLDLMVANDVTQAGAGFDTDTNIATLIFPDGREESLPQMSKLDLADRVWDEVAIIRREQTGR